MGIDPISLALIQIAVSVALTALAQALQPDVKNYGPRLDDLSPTAVQPGSPMARVFGCAPVIGQVIAQTELIEKKKKKKVGGKGGPSVTNTTYTYSVHVAVGISGREIGGIARIKGNEKPLYEAITPATQSEIDAQVAAARGQSFIAAQTYYSSTSPTNPATGSAWSSQEVDDLANAKADREASALQQQLEADEADSSKFYEQIEIFTGTEDQAPSGIMEALEGVGKVPAYRGLAYVVFKNLQLADFGNRVPVFKFETVAALSNELSIKQGPDTGTDLANEQGEYLIDYSRGKWFGMIVGNGPWDSMIEYDYDGDLSEVQIHDLTLLTGDGGGVMYLRGVDEETGYLFGWHGYNPPGPESFNTRAYVYDPATKTVITDKNFTDAQFDDSPSDFETQHYPVARSANGLHAITTAMDFGSYSDDRNSVFSFPDITYLDHWEGPEEDVLGGGFGGAFSKWGCGMTNCFRGSDTIWSLWGSDEDIQFRSVTINDNGTLTFTNYSNIPSTVFHPTKTFDTNAIGFSIYPHSDGYIIGDVEVEDVGGGNFQSFIFRWEPSTETIMWISEMEYSETVTTARGNTRLGASGEIVLYGDNFEFVDHFRLSDGYHTEDLFDPPGPGGFDLMLASTSYDGVNGCLNTYFDEDQTFNVIRLYCWGAGSGCGISIADLIRDAMTVWTPDVSPLIEGDHFEIAPALEDMIVTGATFTRLMSATNVADLCQVWSPIGYFESGDKIKFVERSTALAATIRSQDMRQRAIGEEAPANVVTKREDDIGLPREVRLKFIDQNRLYSANAAYARLNNSQSNLVTEQEVPFVGTPAEAKRAAYRLMSEAFAARTTREFALPLQYFIAEQFDVIDVPNNNGDLRRSRLTSIEFGANFVFRMTAQDHIDDLDVQLTAETGVITATDLIRPLQSIMVALDTHRLTDDPDVDDGSQILIGLGGIDAGWGGGIIYRDTLAGAEPEAFGETYGDPGETDFVEISTIANGLDVGVVVAAPNNDVDELTIDRTGSMIVEFSTYLPDFSSLTDGQFETGFGNVFAVGNNVKGWEIIQAQDVAQVDDQTFEFWTLHRGMRGTEWAIPIVAPGDQVVRLEAEALDRDSFVAATVGNTITYRGASTGTDVVAAADYDLAVVGRQSILYAPALGRVYRDGAGEITGEVVGRALQADVNGQFNLTTAELDFDLVILDGDPGGSPAPGEARTIALTDDDAFTYTAAEQVTDFGSVQSAVYATIYQKDAAGARGYGRNVTL